MVSEALAKIRLGLPGSEVLSREEVYPVWPGGRRTFETHAGSPQNLCCAAAFDCKAYPYFNAVSKLCHFPLINHRFVSTIILGPEGLL